MFLFLWMDTYLLFQSNKNILFVEVAVDYTLDIEEYSLFTEEVLVLIIKYYHLKFLIHVYLFKCISNSHGLILKSINHFKTHLSIRIIFNCTKESSNVWDTRELPYESTRG